MPAEQGEINRTVRRNGKRPALKLQPNAGNDARIKNTILRNRELASSSILIISSRGKTAARSLSEAM